MSATFSIKITRLLVGGFDGLSNVVKQVEFVLHGEENGCSFELPKVVALPDPQPEQFRDLGTLKEADVILWVEENYQDMQAAKDHIQYVISRELAQKGLEAAPLPWAPAPAEAA